MAVHPNDHRIRGDRTRLFLRVGLLVVAIALVYWVGSRLELRVSDLLVSLRGRDYLLLFAVLTAYVLFLAMPFVPGIELGLFVMLVGGVPGILLVYGATVLSLALSYGLGRLVPVSLLGGVLGWLGLRRGEALVHEMEEMTPHQRMLYLTRRVPTRWLSFFLRHRYLALAVALNTPGNAFIGGGGGIGIAAGISGLFPFPHYLALILLAVSPVPLVLIGKAGLG